jgi:acetoacetate decarboxylase
MNKKEEGWIFPFAAPSVPPPPYHMTPETEYLMSFYEADLEALKYEVPEPLELAPDPICMAWIGEAHQPPHTHGRYHEGVIGIKVKYQDLIGWYSPYMWVHTDEALISGHLYGFPKQICDDTPIERLGNQVNAAIKRRGQPLYSMVFIFTSPPVSKRDEPEEAKLGKLLGPVPWLQIKKVPSPEKGGKVLKQLVRIDMERQPPAELWGGNASVLFTPNAYYPHLDRLQPKKYLYACYVRPNTILPHGKVIWEEFK